MSQKSKIEQIVKVKIVEQYLAGEIGLNQASKKLGVACMKKAKSTTFDERLKIVTECLANDKNYGAMALKYQCSYQQIRNWVKRYEEMGSKGLEDRCGRRVGLLPSRTPEEELRDKIAELKRKNLDLQLPIVLINVLLINVMTPIEYHNQYIKVA